MAAPIVLMLDGDVAFMFALSGELTARGISAYPARSVREARSMLQRFRFAPDGLIIDCSIQGACSLVEKVAKAVGNVKIVGIVSMLHHCEECAARLVDTLRDPNDIEPDRIPYCADLVQRLLSGQVHRNGNATMS